MKIQSTLILAAVATPMAVAFAPSARFNDVSVCDMTTSQYFALSRPDKKHTVGAIRKGG